MSLADPNEEDRMIMAGWSERDRALAGHNDDYWTEKFGPDMQDVAEEKRRAIADDPPWEDDDYDDEPPERELPGEEP